MYTVRSFFFDLPFFIVVTVIGRSVITAILISRFSELRGERVRIFLLLKLSATVHACTVYVILVYCFTYAFYMYSVLYNQLVLGNKVM